MEWRHSGSPSPKKFRVQKSAGKFLTSIFWDQDGDLLIDYIPKGQTINSEYYLSLLVQLNDILKEKYHGKVTGGLVLVRQCPGSLGTCNPEETSIPGLPLPWSSTQLSGSAPVGLPPVLWTEKQLKGYHFLFYAAVTDAAETWLDGQPSEFVSSGLQELEQRAKKCIELCGELNKSRVWSL